MLQELEKTLAVNQKVQVTVWDPDNDTVEHSFPSFVADVEGRFLLIAPPTTHADKIVPLMQKGLVVGIVLETYPNPYIFYPVIHSSQTQPKPGFWLRILDSTQVEMVQRRRHVRIPMVLPVEVEYQIGPRWLEQKARTEDVSGGGMKFTGPRLFYKDQLLRLRFRFNEEADWMDLKAKVVFSTENRVKKKPDDLYATACQFYDIDDMHEMLIVRECFARELKLKRGSAFGK